MIGGTFEREDAVDRLTIVLWTVGVWLVLLAGLAGLRLVAVPFRRRGQVTGLGGLATLGVGFIVLVVAVFALTIADLGAALPSPTGP